MATVSSNPTVATSLAKQSAGNSTIRIEPTRGWFNVRLREVWEYRELLYFFVWRDVKVRYKQTVIGVALGRYSTAYDHGRLHSFLRPARQAPLRWPPLSRFLFRRACPLDLFLQRAAELHQCRREQSARHHQSLFPAARPPTFCRVLSGLVDFAIGLRRHACGHSPSTASGPRSPCFGCPSVCSSPCSPPSASACGCPRSTRSIATSAMSCPFLVQFWMFASPVAYPSSLVPQRWRWLYGLNPMAGVIDGFRWALTGHGQPPGPLMLASAAASWSFSSAASSSFSAWRAPLPTASSPALILCLCRGTVCRARSASAVEANDQ